MRCDEFLTETYSISLYFLQLGFAQQLDDMISEAEQVATELYGETQSPQDMQVRCSPRRSGEKLGHHTVVSGWIRPTILVTPESEMMKETKRFLQPTSAGVLCVCSRYERKGGFDVLFIQLGRYRTALAARRSVRAFSFKLARVYAEPLSLSPRGGDNF